MRYKKIHIIPWGVSHVTRSLHFFHQGLRQKKWGELFPGSGLILDTFLFLNSVSESTRGSPPEKTGLIRCSRTKLSWFLSFFLSWGRPCRLHAIRIYSVLPLRLPSSEETRDTRDLSREESELVPPPKPQRRPASPEVHKLPLNSEFCVSEYVNSQQQKTWGTKNVRKHLATENERSMCLLLHAVTAGFLF